MQEWITSIFQNDGLGNVIIDTFPDGSTITVAPSVFAQMTSTITTVPPSYADLSVLPIAKAGWQQYFDDWKAQGIVS